MATRLTRSEQVERNREMVLAAAAEVFLDRGYAAATLEQIAERAGFSRGVVYSQFTHKADLFLTLLERRRDARALENLSSAEIGTWEDFGRHVTERTRSEPGWNLLNIEFRAAIARDQALNDRYAALHATTISALAEVLGRLYGAAEVDPPDELDVLATTSLALAYGMELERIARPAVSAEPDRVALFGRLLGFPARRSPARTRRTA